LTTNSGVDETPSITTTADGNIWVVWSSNRDGNLEIYCKIYNESSWSPDTRLTTNSSKDEFPSVMEDKDGDIWVVWSSNRTGNFEIHYQIYNNTNKEWEPCGQLTSDPGLDWDPSIMQAQDGKIWIVWVKGEDLFYKVVNKNMTDIVLDTPLTEEDSKTDWHPSIMQAQDGRVWIAWDSHEFGDMDIYCKIYDGDWSEERITYNSLDDSMPAILQATDGTIWIAWTSNRLGDFDIYYKTDSSPEHIHDVAIISVNHDPNVSVAYQGLNINIEVVSQNQGAEPENLVVGCYANSTLIGNQTLSLSAGQLIPIDFTWNTSNVDAGKYTITANVSIIGGTDTDAADNTFIHGIITIKILGDINGDGVVDRYDFGNFAGAYGSSIGSSIYNDQCDFDRDGDIDRYDLGIFAGNYGKTI
jgi:hypothetical protein